jgi:hypothetical protein
MDRKARVGFARAFAIERTRGAPTAFRSLRKGAEMRKIYKLRRRDGGRAAALVIMIGALAVVVLASHRATPTAAARPAQAPSASAVAPPATVYFPSQYELHAGPPEEPVQAF